MSSTHNERLKLTAAFLNGIAIAILNVGALAPLLNWIVGSMNSSVHLMILAGVSLVCILLAAMLHLVA